MAPKALKVPYHKVVSSDYAGIQFVLRPISLSLLPLLPGWSFQMGSAYQFHSWRVFVLVCAFPSVAAIASPTTMPESPRFFLEVSRDHFLHLEAV